MATNHFLAKFQGLCSVAQLQSDSFSLLKLKSLNSFNVVSIGWMTAFKKSL